MSYHDLTVKLFFNAIKDNNVAEMKMVLGQDKTIIEAKDDYGNTPMHYACGNAFLSLAVAKMLVELYPASLQVKNKLGNTPLHIAVDRNVPEVVLAYLVDASPQAVCRKNTQGQTPLHISGERLDDASPVIKQMKRAASALIECSVHILTPQRRGGGGRLVLTHELDMSQPMLYKLLKNEKLQDLIGEPGVPELINGVFHMNKYGRAYVEGYAGDKLKGVRVMQSTRDSVDCLFLHLRENPSLCDKKPSSPIKQKPKKGSSPSIIQATQLETWLQKTFMYENEQLKEKLTKEMTEKEEALKKMALLENELKAMKAQQMPSADADKGRRGRNRDPRRARSKSKGRNGDNKSVGARISGAFRSLSRGRKHLPEAKIHDDDDSDDSDNSSMGLGHKVGKEKNQTVSSLNLGGAAEKDHDLTMSPRHRKETIRGRQAQGLSKSMPSRKSLSPKRDRETRVKGMPKRNHSFDGQIPDHVMARLRAEAAASGKPMRIKIKKTKPPPL
jgi:hypothetical protein